MHWMSVLTSHKAIKPEEIRIHYDNKPMDEYWDMIKQIPSVALLKEKRQHTMLGERVKNSTLFTAPSNLGGIKT